MFGLGPVELLVLAVVAFALFAPERIPQVGYVLGRVVAELRRGARPAPAELARVVAEAARRATPEAPSVPSAARSPAAPTPTPDRGWRRTFDLVDATVIALGLACMLAAAWIVSSR